MDMNTLAKTRAQLLSVIFNFLTISDFLKCPFLNKKLKAKFSRIFSLPRNPGKIIKILSRSFRNSNKKQTINFPLKTENKNIILHVMVLAILDSIVKYQNLIFDFEILSDETKIILAKSLCFIQDRWANILSKINLSMKTETLKKCDLKITVGSLLLKVPRFNIVEDFKILTKIGLNCEKMTYQVITDNTTKNAQKYSTTAESSQEIMPCANTDKSVMVDMPTLRVLQIYNISKPAEMSLLSYINLTRLTTFSLPYNHMRPECLTPFSKLDLPSLTALYYSNTKILSSDMYYFSCMNLENLHILHFSYNDFQPSDMEHFSNMKFPNLTELNLSFNRLKAEGIEYFSKMNLPNLIVLDLHSNNIEKEGAANLSKMNFPNLTTLYLNNNKIQAAGMEYLATMSLPKLITIDLYANEIKKKEVELLEQKIRGNTNNPSKLKIVY